MTEPTVVYEANFRYVVEEALVFYTNTGEEVSVEWSPRFRHHDLTEARAAADNLATNGAERVRVVDMAPEAPTS